MRDPDGGQPHAALRQAIRHGVNGLPGRHPGRVGRRASTSCSATRRPGPLGARARRRALLSGRPSSRAGATRPSSTRSCGAVTPAGRRGATNTPTWTPVALDEPAAPVILEPYPDDEADETTSRARSVPVIAPDDEPTRLVRLVARLESLTRRGVASVRTEGAKATGTKAAAKIRNRLQP